jgi:5-keto-L-gluconate epimerase
MITYESAGFKTLVPKQAEIIFRDLKKYRFEAIEPIGVPEKLQVYKVLNNLLQSYELNAPMIAGIWGRFGAKLGTYPLKDPTSSSPMRRAKAIEYIRKCADIAVILNSQYVQVALGSLEDQVLSSAGIEKARRNLIGVIKKAAKDANDKGICLIVEPQCRFEGYYGVNTTVNLTLDIIEKAGMDNVFIMIDTFHANIEERSLTAAIKRARRKLRHIHVADNNRLPPGYGAIQFEPIIREFATSGYKGYLGFECMPIGPKPARLIKNGLGFLRKIERAITV